MSKLDVGKRGGRAKRRRLAQNENGRDRGWDATSALKLLFCVLLLLLLLMVAVVVERSCCVVNLLTCCLMKIESCFVESRERQAERERYEKVRGLQVQEEK